MIEQTGGDGTDRRGWNRQTMIEQTGDDKTWMTVALGDDDNARGRWLNRAMKTTEQEHDAKTTITAAMAMVIT